VHRFDANAKASLIGTALDGLCVGLILMTPGGRVTWMNRASQSILGIDFEDCRQKPFASVTRDPQLSAFWQEALEDESGAVGDIELHWPRPAALKMNATIAVAPGGELIGRALIFCDVTAERMVQVQLSSEATKRLLDVADLWNESTEAKGGLTAQELKVLRHVGAGLSNREISEQMEIAPSTVRTHLKHVYGKLGLRSRSEAISYSVRNGLA